MQTITGEGVFEQAKRKARYGHRDWLVWTDSALGPIAAPRTAESIKAAMLATGSQRTFTMLMASDACPIRVYFRLAHTMLRNAPYMGRA